MTRLIEEWIKTIGSSIRDYEFDLMKKTGLSLVALAAAAGEMPEERIRNAAANIKVGVIPFTSGQGIIGSFSESVAAVCEGMGFQCFIAEGTDVDGIYKARQNGAEILFMADDDRFIALNLKTGNLAENNQATVKGFLAALGSAAGGLKDKEVLVIGCGPVGREALQLLRVQQANPVAYDKNPFILSKVAAQGYDTITHSSQIAAYPLVFDASSEGSWLKKSMLHPELIMAAPGVPLSLDQEAFEIYKDHLIHDYLPIGVATMLALVCK